jgi:serine/threonine protein kinase
MENYIVVSKIGSGTYGSIYKAVDKNTRQLVAIKIIKVEDQKRSNVDPIEEKNALVAMNLGPLRNSYVLRYISSFVEIYPTYKDYYIITEYLESITIGNWMKKNGVMPYNITWPIMIQLCLGLKQIHDAGYAHMDISSLNIMIDENNQIKYIDFGLSCLGSCIFDDCKNSCSDAIKGGTLGYLAPELYTKKTAGDLRGAQKGDIWSICVLMYKLIYGYDTNPFYFSSNTKTLEEYTNDVMNSNYIQRISTIGPDRRNDFLMENICKKNPDERPSITSLIHYINIILFTHAF